MKRLKKYFRKLEVHLCVFLLALLSFNWPLLSIAHDRGPFALYLYLFSGWLVLILLIFFIAISVDSAASSEAGEDGGDDV